GAEPAVAIDVLDRSIAAVLKDIVGNLQQIIRAEVRLATVEVREEIAKARRAAILMIIGGFLATLAIAFLLLAAVYLLATLVQPWLAAVLVALGAAAIGGALLAIGAKQLKLVNLPPPRTATTVQ